MLTLLCFLGGGGLLPITGVYGLGGGGGWDGRFAIYTFAIPCVLASFNGFGSKLSYRS
ncbi:hypothetical protein GGR50DRAFT_683652 [Xylaria sp. CBS 124048]|nr:hypothetical protein GGR50DRAFT_683652 [Xylaria sp. CBS 124048]